MISELLDKELFLCFSRYKTLFVGFSGGLDSTVLVHYLASLPLLKEKIIAVHINHGISTHALSWQKQCQLFCEALGVHFISQAVDFDRSANIEEGARTARYQFFSSLLATEDCLLLGHHLDDQAETVLLQLFRGAGVDGLAAMKVLGTLGLGTIARPLLACSRQQLEEYAAAYHLSWIDDESNQDSSYSRNYLRHHIMPLLKARWPAIAGTIARTALHCQHARNNLDALALLDCPQLARVSGRLDIGLLYNLTAERLTNILRVWLKKNQEQLPSAVIFSRLIDELIYAANDATPEVRWANTVIRRYQQYLYLDKINQVCIAHSISWPEFPKMLLIEHMGLSLAAHRSQEGLQLPQGAIIEVRFRQGGETFFWHGQTRKLKKLLQEWGIPPWLRGNIPLLYINNQLAVIAGYATSDLFFTQDKSLAWLVSTDLTFGQIHS